MANLRDLMDGRAIVAGAKDDVFDNLKKVAKAKADYDVAKVKLHSKLAPTRQLMQHVDQEHGMSGNDRGDGGNGPGGFGQGMNNQDDQARTGQMAKPGQSGGFTPNKDKGGVGKPSDDGNKRLESPEARQAAGKPQQRSTSGNRPPGKTSQATEGKNVKKGKGISISVKAGGPGSGRRPSGILKEQGYVENRGKFRYTSGRQYHYDHSDGSFYKLNYNVDQKGAPTTIKNWHYNGPGGRASGSDQSSFEQHIGSRGKSDDMMADYHDGEVESVPASRGVGISGKAMNLADTVKLYAGGPGSGRRPGGGLADKMKQHGFKMTRKWNDSGEGKMSNWQHKSGAQIDVYHSQPKSGSYFMHYGKGGASYTGGSKSELANFLQKKYGK